MRILILSDLHANATALDAALHAANGRWDRSVCLGDLVGYGPDPDSVIAKIRELGATVIRGNHDKAVANLMDTEEFNPPAKLAVDWTRRNISPDNLAWLTQLPHGPLETDGLVCVHGSFQDEDEYVFSAASAMEGLMDSPSTVTFFGHTHHQGGFVFDGVRNTVEILPLHPQPPESLAALRLEPSRRYLLNPGSVGQPRDADPRAGFAIADLANRLVEFWRVPYDIVAVQARMRAAALPEPLVQRLSVGR